MALTSGDFLARVILPSLSGIAKDVVVNDFAFGTPDDSAPDSAAIGAATSHLTEFYNTTASGASHAVCYYLSSGLDHGSNKVRIDYYHIVVGDLGSPFHSDNFTLGSSGGSSNLPDEVAIATSFHADLTDISEELSDHTRPRARRRGRVYLGTLSDTARGLDANGHAVVSNGARADIALSSKGLHDAAVAAGLVTWSIWSRAAVTVFPVQAGFVDNAFDTQRRRGIAASTRSSWT